VVLTTAAHFRDHIGCLGGWEVPLVRRWGRPAGFLSTIPASQGGCAQTGSWSPECLGHGAGREWALGRPNSLGRTGVLQLHNTPA